MIRNPVEVSSSGILLCRHMMLIIFFVAKHLLTLSFVIWVELPNEVITRTIGFVEDCYISNSVSCLFNLILSDYFLVKFCYFVAIVYLFLGIEVDCSVVDAQFVLSEEGYGDLLQIKEDNFRKDFCTVNFLFFHLYFIV